MDKIKSSWEIAQEKAEKLGKLSSEEKRKQQQDKYHTVGKSLANKYVSGETLRHIEGELNKYGDEDRSVIKHAVLGHLIDLIDLNNSILEKLFQGIADLAGDGKTVEILDKIRANLNSYREAERTEIQNIEKVCRELLHQQRISGTAIGTINPKAREEWQKRLGKVIQPFEENLKNLKQALLQSIK